MLIFTDLAGGSQFSTLFLVYLTATELRKKISGMKIAAPKNKILLKKKNSVSKPEVVPFVDF
jgi:hypothetical protein